MTPVLERALKRLKSAAEDPLEGSSLLLAGAAIDDWMQRTDLAPTERNIKAILLGAAAALEDEYNGRRELEPTDHDHS